MKKYIILLWGCLCSVGVWADIQIKASAPEAVEAGEQFRLVYNINTSEKNKFSLPELNGFRIDYGPSRSQSSSVQIINGKMTQNSSLTLTYILTAEKEGNYSISPATVEIDGEKYVSNSLEIRVLPSTGGRNNGHTSPGGQQREERTRDVGSKITGKDLFVSVNVDKRKLFEQEAVVLTYKVYALVSISNIYGEMSSDLQGFHVQEVPLPQQKSLKMEHYNGRNYQTVVWKQYVLYPQHSGRLTIPAVDYEITVVQQNRSMDFFDAFFNGGSMMTEVKKTIVAPAVTLQVDALPSPRPENFSGAVGEYSIAAALTPETGVKSNDAVTLQVTVSGQGNMKLMKAPTVKFPKDFETYDAKIKDKTKVGRNGVSGSKVFDYIAVPRHAGNYTIPGVEFCYFDTKAKTYKTVCSKDFQIEVAKGQGGTAGNANYINKEDVELLASDIRYIHQDKVSLHTSGDTLFRTSRYLWSYLIPFLLFIVVVTIYRKKALENANIAKIRNKKAGKTAAKRLKQAAFLLKNNRPTEFYDEVLKTLWGYVGDKLNIPVAELNKDNVSEKLLEKGAEETVVSMLNEVMNDCEFARFAPGDPSQAMDKIYVEATEVINKMENSIKHK